MQAKQITHTSTFLSWFFKSTWDVQIFEFSSSIADFTSSSALSMHWSSFIVLLSAITLRFWVTIFTSFISSFSSRINLLIIRRCLWRVSTVSLRYVFRSSSSRRYWRCSLTNSPRSSAAISPPSSLIIRFLLSIQNSLRIPLKFCNSFQRLVPRPSLQNKLADV